MKNWFNKDVKGALFWAAVIFFGGLLLFVVGGCTVHPNYRPELELGMAKELREPVVGSNPVGIARLKQPLWAKDECSKVYLEYEHLSSIPDMDDLNTVDQLGIVGRICLGRAQ